MILINISLTTTPDKRDRFVALLIDLYKKSQAEDGCVIYRYTADLEDANVFHLTELWESEAALNAHLAAPHMGPAMAAMAELCKFNPPLVKAGPLEDFKLNF